MKRFALLAVFVAACFVALFATTTAQDQKTEPKTEAKKKAKKEASTPKGERSGERVRKALMESLNVPAEFHQAVQFKNVLDYVQHSLDERKKGVEIVLDDNAFKTENPEVPNLMESNVTLPTNARRMTAFEMLDWAVRQFPSNNAIVVVANGRVEITTVTDGCLNGRLEAGILFQVHDVPLRQAIDDLADQAGFTVVIDPRCNIDEIKGISVSAQANTSPLGLLKAWADSYDWKVVADNHRVSIMPRADYLRKLRDDAEEAKIRETPTPNLQDLSIPRQFNSRKQIAPMP